MAVCRADKISTEDILKECVRIPSKQRMMLCEDYINDVRTLADRMADLFNEHPGVFMMYGVSVNISIKMFNDDAIDVKLGNPDCYKMFQAMIAEAKKEMQNDQRA